MWLTAALSWSWYCSHYWQQIDQIYSCEAVLKNKAWVDESLWMLDYMMEVSLNVKRYRNTTAPGSLFSKWLNKISGMWLVENSISTNHVPNIWVSLFANASPVHNWMDRSGKHADSFYKNSVEFSLLTGWMTDLVKLSNIFISYLVEDPGPSSRTSYDIS